MSNLKVIGRESCSALSSGFGIGVAIFPTSIVDTYINPHTLILRDDYLVWLGTGFFSKAFLFVSPTPDATWIVAKRDSFSSISEVKNGIEESIWPEDPTKKLKAHLRDYKFHCRACDHRFLPDLTRDEPGHRIRMENHTFYPPQGRVGGEWQPVQSRRSVYAECPLCGKETKSLS